MSCPGLHCAGCGGGVAVPVVVLAALEGAAWVLAHILWILGTAAVCAVLTGVAVARLARWSDARAARLWAQRPVQLHAAPVTEPRAERAAIAPAVVHLNFYGVPADERATIIRTAIERNEPS